MPSTLPSLQSLTNLSAAILGIGIAAAVLRHVPASRLRRAFLLLVGGNVVWNLLHMAQIGTVLRSGPDAPRTQIIFFLTQTAAGLLVLALATFAWAFARPTERLPRPVLGAGLLTGLSIPLLGLTQILDGRTITALLAANVCAMGSLALAVLHIEYRKSTDIGRQRVLLYIQAAAGIGIATSVLDLVAAVLSGRSSLLIHVRQVALGPVGNLLGETIVLLALLRNRLLGTTVPLRRVLSYLTMSLVLGLSYMVVFAGIFRAAEVLYVSLFAATAVITLFLRPLQRGVEQVTSGLFYRMEQTQKRILERLSETLVTELETRALARAASDTLTQLLSVRWVDVWCMRQTGGDLELQRDGAPPGAVRSSMARDHPAIPELGDARGFIDRTSAPAAAARLLDDTGGSAVVSLFAKGRVIGLVVVGPRLYQDAIQDDERDLLMLVANQVAVALDHSLIYRDRLEAEKLALIGRMAAGLAHEVKNPLGAIRGAAQLMRDQVPAESARFLAIIEEETERLDVLVRRFLTMARPQAPRVVPVELGQLLRKIVEAHGVDPAAAGIRVELDDGSRETWIRADPDALVQIVANLLINAREALHGEGTVRLSLAPGSRTGRVALVVADSGPGIPSEMTQTLFEPFVTTKASGTGLGLAMARQLARSMDGALDIDHRDSGAAFRLELEACERPAGSVEMN
jgi:signal transduction histidine kinase